MTTQHLSHAEYAKMCGEAARDKRRLVTHVQAKVFHAHRCGTIIDAVTIDRRDFFKVRIEGMDITVPAFNVLRCSGLDGRCQCAGEVKS